MLKIERLIRIHHFLPGIFDQLNKLVDEMEILVNPQSDIDSLRAQQERLTILAQQFSERIVMLTPEEREANQQTIERLSTRAATIRLTLINSLENHWLTPSDGEGNEINESTNWHEVSHNYFLSKLDSTDDQMDVELPLSNGNNNPQCDVVEQSNANDGMVEPPSSQHPPNIPNEQATNENEQPMVEQPLVGQPNETNQEQNTRENGIQLAAVNAAVANAIQNESEFSFRSLLIYNHPINTM